MNSRLVTWMAPLGLLVSGLVLAFDLPNDSERGKAVGSLAGMDAPMRRAFSDEGEFQKKATPGPMDWLASHPEDGQSFDQWVESKPNLPDAYQRKLYILPIGEFDETAPDIEKLQRYTAAYFYPMAVELLPVVADSKVIAKSRMHGGKKQWNSRDLLGWLPRQLPGNGYAMLAVTMTDLYPEEGWNFVFGQASIKNRVGVFSFARYHPAWNGEAADESTESLVLRRAAKVLTHEMGHMFGIRHCIYYECNMNGANHLDEADSTPMHLCPVCLRKLQRATRFDPASRYGKLALFYGTNELEEEKKWVETRGEKIRAAK